MFANNLTLFLDINKEKINIVLKSIENGTIFSVKISE